MLTGVSLATMPTVAFAGMPSITLTEIARMRGQSISFFLLVLFLSAWAIQGIWNRLRRDFVRLPRLTYRRALGLVAIWGLLFLLVLTMISGARELMTPGAWEKRGTLYQVSKTSPTLTEADRRARLLVLKMALWDYAKGNDGNLPPDDVRGIASATWESPDLTKAHYLYIPGARADVGRTPVAYEPRFFNPPRLVLMSDGQIVGMKESELRLALEGGKTP